MRACQIIGTGNVRIQGYCFNTNPYNLPCQLMHLLCMEFRTNSNYKPI